MPLELNCGSTLSTACWSYLGINGSDRIWQKGTSISLQLISGSDVDVIQFGQVDCGLEID